MANNMANHIYKWQWATYLHWDKAGQIHYNSFTRFDHYSMPPKYYFDQIPKPLNELLPLETLCESMYWHKNLLTCIESAYKMKPSNYNLEDLELLLIKETLKY